MVQPFLGEIRIFGGNFAPAGWARCDGNLLLIMQNPALSALFGTTYGGDGITTFGLPELRGRLPVHAGSGPGLTPRTLGASGGNQTAFVTTAQLPSHDHAFEASSGTGTSVNPVGNSPATPVSGDLYTGEDLDNPLAFAPEAVLATGNTQFHDNMHPYAVINYIVSLQGVFP